MGDVELDQYVSSDSSSNSTFVTGMDSGGTKKDSGKVQKPLTTMDVHIDVQNQKYLLFAGDEHGNIKLYDLKELIETSGIKVRRFVTFLVSRCRCLLCQCF